MGCCVGLHPVCEDVFLLAFSYFLFRYCCAISREKRKRKISKRKKRFQCVMSDPMVSLTEYFDLVWCLHNDLWRPFILFDDTNDLHLLTQVVGI